MKPVSDWLNGPVNNSDETAAGMQIAHAGRQIVLFQKSLQVRRRIPILNWLGGLVWQRPDAVWVQDAQGHELVLPVKDMTRLCIVAIWVGAAAMALLRWSIFRRK